MVGLAFPDYCCPPAKRRKLFMVTFVAFNVFLELFLPEPFFAFGIMGVFTISMPVPEATMDKNNGFVFWKYYIGFAWKVLTVKPKAETHFVKL